MSAVATRGASGFAALCAASPRRHRIMIIAVYCVFAGLGAVVTVFGEDPARGTRLGTSLLGFGTAMLWAGWVARLAPLRALADGFALPHIATAVRSALLGAALWSVGLPALLLIAAGADPLHVVPLLVLAAAGGILLASLQMPLFALLILAPAFFGGSLLQLSSDAAASLGISVAGHRGLWLAAAAVVALAVWRWRRLRRIARDDAVPNWRRPVVMMRPQPEFALQGERAAGNAGPGTRPGALLLHTRVDDAGPHAPARAIGACIGGAMARWRTRDVLLAGGALAALIGVPWMLASSAATTALRAALLGGAGTCLLALGWMVATRLETARQRNDGALAELALLPGLGNPEQARRQLLRLVGQRLLRAMALLAVALAALVLWRGGPPTQVAVAAALWIGLWGVNSVLCLVPLSGGTLRGPAWFLAALPVVVLTMASILRLLLPDQTGGSDGWLGLGWGTLLAACAATGWALLRRFRALPHPFLAP